MRAWKLTYFVQVPAAILVGRGEAEDVVVVVVVDEVDDVVVVVVVVDVIEVTGVAIATQ